MTVKSAEHLSLIESSQPFILKFMSREELHRLVDTLPEGALEAAKQALQHFRIWPQQPFLQIERMRQRHRPAGTSVRAESYSGSSGGQVPSGRFSFNHWEENTAVVETHIFHDGHEVIVTERLRIGDDGKCLAYANEVVGPKGKAYSQNLSFDVD
jgi:hypothetical protein